MGDDRFECFGQVCYLGAKLTFVSMEVVLQTLMWMPKGDIRRVDQALASIAAGKGSPWEEVLEPLQERWTRKAIEGGRNHE